MKLHRYIVVLVCTISMVRVHGVRVCTAIDECSCKFADDQSVIDISSLGNTDGTPRFSDIQSRDGYLYSYNPCHPFNEGVCKNAAACKKDRVSGETLMIGSADMPQFTYDDSTGDTVIGYTAGPLGEFHSFVYLMCDTSEKPGPPQFFPNGTLDMPNIFFLTLFSVCACTNKCDANGIIGDDNSLKLTMGTWILLGCIIVFTLYWIVGISYMKFVKKSSGRDIIPHASFWFGLPTLIKSGVLCITRGCKRDSKYNNM